MRLESQQVRQSAQGQWRAILIALGLPEDVLRNRHGPCPLCGGADRFRWDNRRAEGDYFCNGCGPGDGFDLLMKFHGWDFVTTMKRVNETLGGPLEADPFREPPKVEDRRTALNAVWRACRESDPAVVDYLCRRGLALQTAQAAAQRLRMGRIQYRSIGSGGPSMELAMVAMVQGADGKPVSLHRTYFLPGGREKKLMPGLGEVMGAAIRLGRAEDDALVVGEGIETTLAGMELFGAPGWAAISANGMKALSLPAVRRVVILADHDASWTGQAAAFELARILKARKQPPGVTVALPVSPGDDMLDCLAGNREFFVFEEGGNECVKPSQVRDSGAGRWML